MRALPFQAPAPHVYIRMRQANIEKRLSKSWPKKIRPAWAPTLAANIVAKPAWAPTLAANTVARPAWVPTLEQ